jgi:hypothetical protein
MYSPMKIYRVTLDRKNGDGSGGFQYCRTKREAKSFSDSVSKDNECRIDVIEVKVNAVGILSALNSYGGHPDNG